MHSFVYFLYSNNSDKYYTGYSNNPKLRLEYHNKFSKNTFTTKHRPWELKATIEVKDESRAIKLERYIKKRKSRPFIIKCIDNAKNIDFLEHLFNLAGLH